VRKRTVPQASQLLTQVSAEGPQTDDQLELREHLRVIIAETFASVESDGYCKLEVLNFHKAWRVAGNLPLL